MFVCLEKAREARVRELRAWRLGQAAGAAEAHDTLRARLTAAGAALSDVETSLEAALARTLTTAESLGQDALRGAVYALAFGLALLASGVGGATLAGGWLGATLLFCLYVRRKSQSAAQRAAAGLAVGV